ncbi:hypothetical protein SprV_0200818400 [Sparganum proliferum]
MSYPLRHRGAGVVSAIRNGLISELSSLPHEINDDVLVIRLPLHREEFTVIVNVYAPCNANSGDVTWRIRYLTKYRTRAMDGCERSRERICQSDEAEAPIGIGNVSDYSTKTPTATKLMLPTALPSRRRSCSGHPTWLGAVRSVMMKFMDASRVRQDGEEPASYVAVDSRIGDAATATAISHRRASSHIRYARRMGICSAQLVQAEEEQRFTGMEEKLPVATVHPNVVKVGRTKSDIFPNRRRVRKVQSSQVHQNQTAHHLVHPWTLETTEKKGHLRNPSTSVVSPSRTSRETESGDFNRPLSTPPVDSGLCSFQHNFNRLEAVRYAANIALEMAREATIEAAERARRETARFSRSPSASLNSRTRCEGQTREPTCRLAFDRSELSSPNDDNSNDHHSLVPSQGFSGSAESSVQRSENCHEVQQQKQLKALARSHLIVRPNTLHKPYASRETQSANVLSTQSGHGCASSSNRTEEGRDWAARRRSLLRRQACISGGVQRGNLRSLSQLCAPQGHSFDSSVGGHNRTSAAADTRTDFERFGYQVVDVSRPSKDDIGRWRVIIKPEVFHRFNPRQAPLRSRQNPRCGQFVSAAFVSGRKPILCGEDRLKKQPAVTPMGMDVKCPYNEDPRQNDLKCTLCSSWPTGGIFGGTDIFTNFEGSAVAKQIPRPRLCTYDFNIPFADIRFDKTIQKGNRKRICNACHGPSLFETLHVCCNKLSYREGMRILRELSQALSYLHGRAKNIVVKCLNSRNIFLEPKVVLSLLDYSSLECRTDRPGYLAVPVSSVRYTAPELLQAARASEVTYSSRVANSDSAYPDEATPSVRVTTVVESEATDITEGSSVDLGFTIADNRTEISSVRLSTPRSLRGNSFLYSSGVSISSVFFSSPGSCSSSSSSAATSVNDSVPVSAWERFKRPLYTDDIDLVYEQQAILSVTRWLGRRYSMSNLLETGHFYSKFSKIFPWNMARSNSLPQIASQSLSVASPPHEPLHSPGPSGTAVWSARKRRQRGANQSFPALQMTAADEQSFRFPLILPEQCCARATDIFALGTIIYEIFSGTYPMPATSASQYATYIIHGHRADLTTLKVSSTIQELISACWSHEPTHRPAISEICIDLIHRSNNQRDHASSDVCRVSGCVSLPTLAA